MPWFKVDDQLHDHPKVRAAGKAAMGVWVLAGSWAADRVNDGFVPRAVIGRWGTSGDAARLVKAGLWAEDSQDGEDGWRFNDWNEYQPTRSQIEEVRAKRAASGRLGGKRSGELRRKHD